MKIEAKVTKLTDGGKTKALASIIIEDAVKIDGIRVMDGANGLFVSMPSKKDEKAEKGYRDVAYPITKEARELVQQTVLDAYNKA